VQWKDGWPLMGVDQDGNGIGEPVLQYRKPDVGAMSRGPILAPQTSDEFEATKLGLQWQWHANHNDDRSSLTDRKGWLRLRSRFSPATNLKSANLLLQKYPAESFVVETRIDASGLKEGELAGVTVMGTKYTIAALRRSKTGMDLACFSGDTKEGTKE